MYDSFRPVKPGLEIGKAGYIPRSQVNLMGSTLLKHGQPGLTWLNMAKHGHWSNMDKHGQTYSDMVKHVQTWSSV